MNGRELGIAAVKLRPGLKIIYMTGYPRNAVTHHGRVGEGLEVLQKPITQSLLGRESATRSIDCTSDCKSSLYGFSGWLCAIIDPAGQGRRGHR